MNLDTDIKEFIRISERAFPSGCLDLAIEQQRALYDAYAASFNFPYPQGIESEDVTLSANSRDIPIRIYRHRSRKQRATLVYFHGGGWILGGLNSHDSVVAEITTHANVNTVSVDYRLAPEHRFPAALNDAYEAICQLKTDGKTFGLDANKLALAGDSAGGNLTAACCLRARNESGPTICAQILIYPALAPELTLPSHTGQAEAPMGSKSEMLYYYRHYFGKNPPYDNPYAMPLAANDFSGLPPGFVITAEYDVLRDDGKVYAQRLDQAGISCEYVEGKGLIHGFLRARRMSDKAADAMSAICNAVHRLVA